MKKLFFYFLFAAALAIFIEAGASTFLLYHYRLKGEIHDSRYLFSSAIAADKILARLGLRPAFTSGSKYQFDKEMIPEPFFQTDEAFGFSAIPRAYQHFYKRRFKANLGDSPWERLETKVTINPDGSRWTGQEVKPGLPSIYILGDSFVFGSGVSDEQTFSYHLQKAMPQTNVRLFALPDYNSAHAYKRVELLKDKITAADTLVVGYADYFDHRNVAAPSWMLAKENYLKIEHESKSWPEKPNLKAGLNAQGGLIFSILPSYCKDNGDYCRQPEPSEESMAKVTAALINGIAAMTPAKVCLLYFHGRDDNPVLKMLDKRIAVISAIPEDFDSFIKDDVAGFDEHPGPYWHYAVSRRLIEKLGAKLN